MVDTEYKQLVDLAAMAGKIMLENGAEIYRVEDTIRYILSVSGLETKQAFVLSTGLMISLGDPAIDAITVIRRVENRGTHLNAISKVNEISRDFYMGKLSLDEAYVQIKGLQANQYPSWLKDIAMIFVSAFFTGMFGGNAVDMVIAGGVGVLLAVWTWLTRGIRMHGMIRDFIGSFLVSVSAAGFLRIPGVAGHLNLIIIGAIMVMVPGAAITNAIRDTLHGDYSAGGAKILEAFVKAAMIALGVYCGLFMMGGRLV